MFGDHEAGCFPPGFLHPYTLCLVTRIYLSFDSLYPAQ